MAHPWVEDQLGLAKTPGGFGKQVGPGKGVFLP
jgi:hypothetical protein